VTETLSVLTVGAAGEATIVAWIRAQLAPPSANAGVLLAVGDDAAVVAPIAPVVLSMDAISAGSDWLEASVVPADIGHRAVAVNLSDLAAMGATPRWLLLGLELNPTDSWPDLQSGIREALTLARRHGAALIGGDVGIRVGPTTWTITAVGEQRDHLLRRDRALAGDRVWLVGALGLAALGLRSLRDLVPNLPPALRDVAERSHRRPTPQVEAGLALATTDRIHAVIDVSDGLGVDAHRLAVASGVALALEIDELPGFDASTQASLDSLSIDWRSAVAAGGDDYALLVCADAELDVAALLAEATPDVYPIGRVIAGYGVHLTLAGVDATALLGGFHHGSGRPLSPSRPSGSAEGPR
jgi:thiamine-monophosphate kinase